MNSRNAWTIGTVLAIVVLIAGTWLLTISPKLAEASAAATQLGDVEAQNSAHEATLAGLEKLAKGMDELDAELAALQLSVPNTAALDELVGQLNTRATTHAVVVTSITVGSPQPYLAPAETVTDAELSRASSSVSSDNFIAISIELSLAGSYSNVMDFIADVQNGDRLYLVHDLSLTEGNVAADTPVTITASGQVFVLLDPSQVPAAPAAEGAATEGAAAAE